MKRPAKRKKMAPPKPKAEIVDDADWMDDDDDDDIWNDDLSTPYAPPVRRKKKKTKKKRRRRREYDDGGGGFAIGGNVGAGLGMMALAVVWFCGGLAFGFIFFYPPILFIFGLVACFRGD